MSEKDKLILGTLAGVDLVLSPEHYEEYKGTLNKQLEEKDKEIDRLNNIINELEKWLKDNLGNCRTNQNYTSNQVYNIKEDTYYKCLDKLKELKENK